MRMKSEKSLELYRMMKRRGYQEAFCDQITLNLNTDFTAQRMIGYLYQYENASLEDIVDEMLAILSDRERIIKKKELENANAKWNDFLNRGFEE